MKTIRLLLATAAACAAFPLLGNAATAPAASSADATSPATLNSERPHLRRQAPGPRAQRRQAERGKLAERLDLSAEQKEQLQAKRATAATAAKAIRSDASLTPEQKQAKLRELHQQAQSDFRSVLTPDQQAKLDTMKRRAHRAAHRRTSL